uniref:Protein N-terminal glutamine amidohydrolase n=2 Tax=Clytia hemisphaerica TaxID=252671 RepID=A0A7M5WV89_9CNID
METVNGGQSTSSNVRKSKKPLQVSNCVYTSCYCEENVWKLCDQIRKTNPTELNEYYAVFISNKNHSIPLWMQKQSEDPLTAVVWDYHVILVQKPPSDKALVYDLDSIMGFPCPLELYLQQAIQSDATLKKEYHR